MGNSGGHTVPKNVSMKKSQRQSSFASHEVSRDHERELGRVSQRPRYPVPEPEVVDMDDLSRMLDEDIYGRLNSLESDRYKVLEARMDPRLWEEEIAYVRREISMRRERRGNHEKYVRDQARAFADEEARLPAADFDNLKYMVN